MPYCYFEKRNTRAESAIPGLLLWRAITLFEPKSPNPYSRNILSADFLACSKSGLWPGGKRSMYLGKLTSKGPNTP